MSEDTPIQTSEEDHDLRVRVEVSDKLQAFLGTAAGRRLTSMAQADTESAFADFLELDPTDTEAVRKAQLKAIVADMALGYIRDAIVDGEQAKTAIDTRSFIDS